MNYVSQGHASIEYTNDPAHICVRIEDELIEDARATFPSIACMARVELAIAAGQSNRKVKSPPADPYGNSYEMMRGITKHQNRSWITYDEVSDWMYY